MIPTMAEAQAKDELCRIIDQMAKSIIRKYEFQSEMEKKKYYLPFWKDIPAIFVPLPWEAS